MRWCGSRHALRVPPEPFVRNRGHRGHAKLREAQPAFDDCPRLSSRLEEVRLHTQLPGSLYVVRAVVEEQGTCRLTAQFSQAGGGEKSLNPIARLTTFLTACSVREIGSRSKRYSR